MENRIILIKWNTHKKKGFQKKRGSANFIKVCINFIKNMGVSADGNTRKSIGIPFDLVN